MYLIQKRTTLQKGWQKFPSLVPSPLIPLSCFLEETILNHCFLSFIYLAFCLSWFNDNLVLQGLLLKQKYIFCLGWWHWSKIRLWQWLHNSVNALNPLGCTLYMEEKCGQLCLTLWDPMDYTVHGILQAGILDWAAFAFSRGSSQSGDQTQVSGIAGGFFTSWATREALTWDNIM